MVSNIFYISIIIMLCNDKERIENCFESIINQKIDNIEVICLSDSSKCLNYTKRYKYAINNLRIIDLTENDFEFGMLNSEYTLFLNTDDWFTYNSILPCYNKAKEQNLDILIFNIIKYYSNHYEKDLFFDVSQFDKEFIPRIFNHDDVYDVLFLIPKVLFNKLYKTELLKMLLPDYFKDNNFFKEQILFFKTFLYAKRISFIEDIVYVKNYNQSYKKLPSFILNDLVKSCNDIISFFKDINLYDTYKFDLLNYKFDLIKFWYSFLKKEFKQNSHEYIHKDFINMNVNFFVQDVLTENNKLFFNDIINSHTNKEYDLLNRIRVLENTNSILLKNIYSQDKLNKTTFNIENYKIDDSIELVNNLINELYVNINTKLDEVNSYLEDVIDENTCLKIKLDEVNSYLEDIVENNLELTKIIKKNNITMEKLNHENKYLNLKLKKLKSNELVDNRLNVIPIFKWRK